MFAASEASRLRSFVPEDEGRKQESCLSVPVVFKLSFCWLILLSLPRRFLFPESLASVSPPLSKDFMQRLSFKLAQSEGFY